MSDNAKKTKNVKTNAELIAEFGKLSLTRIARSAIPSEADIQQLDKVSKEVKALEASMENIPEIAKPFAMQALDGLKYRKAIIAANLANPGNLSVTDIRMLQIAAKRLLRADKANVVTLAQFVLDNVEVFPVKGTRY
jgi:capsular polysaccharide biosynthesis protein